MRCSPEVSCVWRPYTKGGSARHGRTRTTSGDKWFGKGAIAETFCHCRKPINAIGWVFRRKKAKLHICIVHKQPPDTTKGTTGEDAENALQGQDLQLL